MSDPRFRWAWPVAVVTAAAIFALAGYLIFSAVSRAPGDILRSGGEAMAEIARAFREGTVETRFRSYATSVAGSSHLQFSTLETTESFARKDSATVLWGQLALPDVVVEATVPVTYTFYLDLEEPWRLDLEGRRVTVSVPGILFNPPAADISALEMRVVEDSLLRDTEAATEALRMGLTPLLDARASEKIELVRELGRRRAEVFVREWILHDFADAEDLRIEVVFGDESPGLGPGLQTTSESEG